MDQNLPPLVDGPTGPTGGPEPAPVRRTGPIGPAIGLSRQNWPKQAAAAAFFSVAGTLNLIGSNAWVLSNTTHVECPWTLHMDGQKLNSILINKKCAPSLTRVLAYVWDVYGRDQEKIEHDRADRFSGSYNYRAMRGGAHLSMHGLAAAIDWDDADNQQGHLSHFFTTHTPLIAAFLEEGWEWGGFWHNESVDAMHVQATQRV
jgi:hypothetical protein